MRLKGERVLDLTRTFNGSRRVTAPLCFFFFFLSFHWLKRERRNDWCVAQSDD